MGIVITGTPSRNVNDDPTAQSRWSSVHQPLLFQACRRDVAVIQVNNNGGVYRMYLASMPPELVVGGQVWLSSQQNDLLVRVISITGVMAIIEAVSGSIANTITLGGYANLITGRPAYYVQIDCYGVDASNAYFRIGTQDLKPAPNGRFTFNLHGYLKHLAKMGDDFDYLALNKKIIGASGRYNYTYQEHWRNKVTLPSALNDVSTHYWVNATKQLQERYNFNVGHNVTFPTVNTTEFLSDFEKPTYFPGFPFSIRFIWSDKVAGLQLQRIEDDFTTETATDLDTAQVRAVNALTLSGTYASSVKEIDLWLNEDGHVDTPYVSPIYVSGLYSGNMAIESPVIL